MTLLDLSNNIWLNDLNETTDTTIVRILAWLQGHIGELNDLISTNYQLNGNDAIPQLGDNEAAIFALIYLHRYYQRQVKNNLGASQYDWSEISEADSTVRRVSKNEISKTYRLLANDIKDNLYKIAEYYKKFKCVPASINFSTDGCYTYTKILQQP